MTIPPSANKSLLIHAAEPYIGTGHDPRLIEIFEAAHSVMLAIFSTPSNHSIAHNHLSQYVDTLFAVFPHNLSSRQFRLAVKTLVRITSPPFWISEAQPLLSSILMEMVRARSETASREILPPLRHQVNFTTETPVTEQAAMVLTLIDSLTSLPFEALEEWLPLTVEAMNQIQDPTMLDQCRHRFWEVLSNGEMDVARAETCLAWWNTLGGREAVLHGRNGRAEKGWPFMSGALPEESKL